VIDVDIKGFFDNISHDIMLQLLHQHTQEKWVMLYAERWLKAGVEQEDGRL
jgi:retron-type reverse transcriptase